MQTILYAGLRNAARDQAIAAMLEDVCAEDVAAQFKLSQSAVYAARRRISSLTTFDLTLEGGGSPVGIGKVAAESFRKAALGAYRNYHGTFRHLDLPCWVIVDGENRIPIMDLRKIDTGDEPL